MKTQPTTRKTHSGYHSCTCVGSIDEKDLIKTNIEDKPRMRRRILKFPYEPMYGPGRFIKIDEWVCQCRNYGGKGETMKQAYENWLYAKENL